MAANTQLNPSSLIARVIAELQASPEARRLLLRTLLTNEFLGMPARLDQVEKDIAELKADVAELKADVAELKTDVAYLKGSDLENRLHRRIRARVSQALELRRAQIVQSPLQETRTDYADHVQEALESGRITQRQDVRLEATDFIIHAQRRADGVMVWVAVEASNRVHARDIERACATAEALNAVFGTDSVAVVAGYGIDSMDAKRATAAGVEYLEVALPG